MVVVAAAAVVVASEDAEELVSRKRRRRRGGGGGGQQGLFLSYGHTKVLTAGADVLRWSSRVWLLSFTTSLVWHDV